MFEDGKSASNINEKVNLLNDVSQSVYSPKENFRVNDIQPENPTPTNFSVTRKQIYQILIELDFTKWRGPNGYPPVFYQKTAKK